MNDWADVKRVPAAELAAMVGRSFVSRWLVVDQARIDAFAKVTEDEQFIHVDPERAARRPHSAARSPTASSRSRCSRPWPIARCPKSRAPCMA